MSDVNHMHEFDPNTRGFCKQYVRGGICHQTALADVHLRWQQHQAENPNRETKLARLRYYLETYGSDVHPNIIRIALIDLIEILEEK